MAARSLRDTEQFKMGRRGEQVVAAMFRELGWGIIPSYDYAGPDGDRAPSLQGKGWRVPLPDLDTARSGQRRWVEIKTKNAATFTYKTRQLEHGIDLDKYEQYLVVEHETGVEVWLAFYELDTQTVLYQSLDRLADVVRRYEGDKMGRHGMAFFPRTELLLLGTVKETPSGAQFELAQDAPRSSKG
ncbi:MAG TPA: hypothetical protein VIL10_05465 [Marmoricola sp.]|jgi:hypothetical protein